MKKKGNLIITRELGQRIMVGDLQFPNECLVISVTAIRGNKVRISIQAPHGVPIKREELLNDFERNLFPVFMIDDVKAYIMRKLKAERAE